MPPECACSCGLDGFQIKVAWNITFPFSGRGCSGSLKVICPLWQKYNPENSMGLLSCKPVPHSIFPVLGACPLKCLGITGYSVCID